MPLSDSTQPFRKTAAQSVGKLLPRPSPPVSSRAPASPTFVRASGQGQGRDRCFGSEAGEVGWSLGPTGVGGGVRVYSNGGSGSGYLVCIGEAFLGQGRWAGGRQGRTTIFCLCGMVFARENRVTRSDHPVCMGEACLGRGERGRRLPLFVAAWYLPVRRGRPSWPHCSQW